MDIGKMYVDELLSIKQIHQITKIPLSTIRFRLFKCGLLRTRTEGVRIAGRQGRTISNTNENWFTDEIRQKIAETKRQNTLKFSEKTSIKPSGYKEYTRGEYKGKSEHRVVMEKFLGRNLTVNEVVHHIDHDKTNNSIENLMVMDRIEHIKMHASENYIKRNRLNNGRFE